MKIQKRLMITILLSALLLMSGACGRRQSTIMQGRMGNASTLKQKEEDVAVEEEILRETEEEAKGTLSGLYLLKKIDTGSKKVSLVKAGNNRQEEYSFDTATMFLDKYGNSKSQTSFISGEAVEIQVEKKTDVLQKVMVTDRVWVQEDITNYSVDESAHAITIGKTKYSYDEELPIFSGDITVGFDTFEEEDVIRAVGIDKKIISLSVTKGHGYLVLSNTKLFDGSFICVGDKIFEEVKSNKKITVPEGTHLVTVANEGYGGSKEVTIERNLTTNLNLDELKGEGPKTCKITFHVGIEGAVLTIDGEKVDYTKPVEVRYGVHNIAVGAEGYETVKNKLVVNSKEAEIEIGLTKADTTETKSQNNSGNNSNNNNSNNNSNSNNNNTANNNNGNNYNNNTNNNNNSNNTNNNNSNNNNSNTNDNSTDYLTTLYNLLTSINNSGTGSGGSTGGTTTSDILDSYNDLRDQ